MKIQIFFSVLCGFRCKGFDCFYRFYSSFRSRDWDRIAESRHGSGRTRRSSDRIKWLRVVISDQRFDVVARRRTSDVSLSMFRLSTVLLEHYVHYLKLGSYLRFLMATLNAIYFIYFHTNVLKKSYFLFGNKIWLIESYHNLNSITFLK